jgi:hypothetical protein
MGLKMRENFNELEPKIQKLIFNMVSDELKRCNYAHQLKSTIKKFNRAIGELFSNEEYSKKIKKVVCDCLKDIYKYEENHGFFTDNPLLVNQWLVSDENYGESWDYVYIFKAKSEEEVIEPINKYGRKNGIYMEADEIHSSYDCTGQTFSWGMYVRKVGKDLFLATKHFALDV